MERREAYPRRVHAEAGRADGVQAHPRRGEAARIVGLLRARLGRVPEAATYVINGRLNIERLPPPPTWAPCRGRTPRWTRRSAAGSRATAPAARWRGWPGPGPRRPPPWRPGHTLASVSM